MFLPLLILLLRFSRSICDKVDLLLTKNENYPLQAQSIVIPIDYIPSFNEEKFFQSSTFQQSIQSFSQSLVELKKVYNIQENFQNIFQLISADEEEVKICYAYSKEIICDQTFKNYLLDNQIIELKRNSLNFQTNSSYCLTVFEISLNIYLLECDDLQGKWLKLINQNSLIINQLLIPAKFNKSMHILQLNQTYIIYEIFKNKCYFTFVEISNNFNLEVVKSYFLNENLTSDDIVWITSQKNDKLIIVFNQFSLEMDLTYFHFNRAYNINDSNRKLFRSISKQKTLQFIIDQTQQQQIKLDKRRVIINPENDQLRNAFIINQNYILYFESKVFISNTHLINYTITQEFQEVLDLGNLPIIFGVTKAGQIKIYQIFDLPYSINLNSSKVLFVINVLYLNFQTSNIYTLHEYKLETSELVAYDQKNLIFILKDANLCWNSDKQLTYLHDITEIKISNYLYGTLWQIIGFKDFDKIILTLDQFQILQYKPEQLSPLLLIYIENILFEFYKNKTLVIQNTLEQKYQFQNYNFNIDDCQVFTSISNSNVIIVDKKNKKLVFYQWQDQEIKSRQLKLKSKINSLFQQDDILIISLENCTHIHILIKTLEFLETIENLQQNCTNQYLYSQKKIFFSSNLIIITWITQEVYTFQNIIEFQKLSNSYYIMFELIQNYLQSYIYCLEGTKLIYLRKLITQEYQIHYPIQYKTYKMQFLALLVFKINQENNLDYFVLIYDYDKPISSQLLKAIPIDDSHSQFSFIQVNRFITIYKKDVHLDNFLGVYVSIKQTNLNFDTYIKASPIQLEIKSQISNQQLSLNITYVFVNNNQTLRKRLENSKNYFIFSENRKSKIINISNIFGNIDYIFYNNVTNRIPLKSTEIVDILQCKQYIVDICLKDKKSLIINSFSDPYNLNIENLTILYLIKYEKFINGSYLYYLDDNYFLQKLILNEKMVIISKQPLHYKISQLFNDVQIIGQIMIAGNMNMKEPLSVFQIKNEQIVRLLLNNQNSFNHFKILFKNKKYYMMSQQNLIQSSIIFAIADENVITTFQHIFSLQEILDQEWILLDQKDIKDIQLIDFIYGDTEMKTDFILCFQVLQCYRILLIFNRVDQSFFSKIQNVIRYGNKKELSKLELLNNQYLILKLTNLQYNHFFEIYNLNQDNFIIDSYSTNEFSQLDLKFYQYNQTHFIENSNNLQEHNMRKFVDYQVQCNDICDNDEVIITFQNDVSSINLTFVQSESNSQSQTNSQLVIILINALLIILFNTKKWHIKKQKNNKNTIIIENR